MYGSMVSYPLCLQEKAPVVHHVADSEQFDELVRGTAEGTLLVCDFTASWCPPCKAIGPR